MRRLRVVAASWAAVMLGARVVHAQPSAADAYRRQLAACYVSPRPARTPENSLAFGASVRQVSGSVDVDLDGRAEELLLVSPSEGGDCPSSAALVVRRHTGNGWVSTFLDREETGEHWSSGWAPAVRSGNTVFVRVVRHCDRDDIGADSEELFVARPGGAMVSVALLNLPGAGRLQFTPAGGDGLDVLTARGRRVRLRWDRARRRLVQSGGR